MRLEPCHLAHCRAYISGNSARKPPAAPLNTQQIGSLGVPIGARATEVRMQASTTTWASAAMVWVRFLSIISGQVKPISASMGSLNRFTFTLVGQDLSRIGEISVAHVTVSYTLVYVEISARLIGTL